MTMTSTNVYAVRLGESLPRVRDRMARATREAGREVADVCLVAVTKSHPIEAVTAALGAGLTDLGENRVTELQAKVAEVGREGVRWHMIGHVQRRKAAGALAAADLIHSVDTLHLGQRISRLALERGLPARILAQVNTSGERAKSGFPAESAVEDVHRLAELPGIHVGGLMTMAPFVDDEAVLSSAFRSLRRILEHVRMAAPQVGSELSMGMTNDMEIAIREGSTMVRIGTALFGERAR